MRRRRLAAAALIAVALAPGTFWRSQIPGGVDVQLSVSAISDLPAAASSSGFTREGVWQLSSPRIDFGGYSALLVLDESTLRAFSDRGKMLTFAAPGRRQARDARIANVWDRGELSQTVPDIEATTRDPATGDYWLAFENTHSLIRFTVASGYAASRRPPEWQGWYANSGVEAMARLPDGRFIVLPERAATGFLYPSDPAEDVEPLAFDFTIPGDYNPTDMAALPDGRVLVLLRRLGWGVPPFASAIAIADPRELEDGAMLEINLLVDLATILPRENYEALALAGVEADGTIQLWLMSDDNLSAFQSTLLARLSWAGDAQWRKSHE